MIRQRLTTITFFLWLIVLFNIERSDYLGINLPPSLYIASIVAVVAVLLVADFTLIRWYVLLLPIVLVYGTYRFLTISDSSIPEPLVILMEIMLLTVTLFLGWLISKQTSETERTYDALVMNAENSRLLTPVEGEQVINNELYRARNYERPVSLLLVKPPGLQNLREAYPAFLDYQVALQHRYLKARISQLSEALLYATDPIMQYGDNLVICLPETDINGALKLARRIAAVVSGSLGVNVQIGTAQLSKEHTLFQDLMAQAEKRLYIFVRKDANAHDDDAQSPRQYKEDDTLPLPLLVEENQPVFSKMVHDAGAELLPENKNTQSNKPAKQGIFHKLYHLFDSLYSNQLAPLQEMRIQGNPMGKYYRNPDFWVNQIPYQSEGARHIYNNLKRLMDIVLIVLALPLLLPIVCGVALLIYLEDRGPILYSQERTGLGGKPFKMYKFRSMIVDADKRMKEWGVSKNERGETVDSEGNKLKYDPRITRVGRFIRKTSLDELPQLWNIFVGHMSLVGPRPTTFGVDKYSLIHTHRLRVKPGLTGLWQVYDRGDTDFDNRLIWDMRYIDKMCFWMDVQILFLTFTRQILKRRGA